MQSRDELCSIVGSEFAAKTVQEDAVSAVEEWKRARRSRKAREFERDRECIREQVFNALERASCDFISQLGNLDDGVNVERIYEVGCSLCVYNNHCCSAVMLKIILFRIRSPL